MTIKSGKIEAFAEFSKFKDLKEFNTHMEQGMLLHRSDFAKGELVGLKRLVRFSAEVPGVCNAKIGTMLKAIHEEYNENGISRSTFKRMIQKAIKFGIMEVRETERKNGSQSSNLYVFNRFPSNEPPKGGKMNHPETINLSKLENQKSKERPVEGLQENPVDLQQLNHTFANDKVPQPFVSLVTYFFNDAKTIEEYWKMTRIAAYRNCLEERMDTVLEIALHAFRQLIGKMKAKRNVKRPIAYYYGILEAKFLEVYFQDLREIEIGAGEAAFQ